MLNELSTIVERENDQKCWLFKKNKINVDIKFNHFTYISAKNDVVIGENVEKCWIFNFYLTMLKF